MNILIVWRSIPREWDVSTNKVLRMMQYLYNEGNEVTIITFKNNQANSYQINLVKKYSSLFLISYPSKFHTCISNLKYLNISLFPFSQEMMKVIRKVIVDKKIDLIYIDQYMLNHVLMQKIKIPIVLDIVDPLDYSSYQYFKSDKNIIKKTWFLFNYIYYKYFELPRYKYIDAYIFVSSIHKELLSSYIPNHKMKFCIPQGVDTEQFTPNSNTVNSNCLIFTGTMSYPPNVHATVFFCNKIFPHIKKEIPDVKFYIVGTNPHEDVLKLKSESIIITGFVEDISLYFKKSSVVVVPIVTDDGGFKVKVLEAMSMGKAIVSTSLGTKGLNVTDGENIFIRNDPEEFAAIVINLLKNSYMKSKIEKNARDFVVDHYSYEVMEHLLFEAFKSVLRKTDS